MDWNTIVRTLRALLARWIVPRMILDAASPASVEQLGVHTESQRVGNIMTSQEVPGAPPEPEPVPQSEPDLATFVTDLNKLPQKFTSKEAAQLWSIHLRSLDELKHIREVAGKAGGSEAAE